MWGDLGRRTMMMGERKARTERRATRNWPRYLWQYHRHPISCRIVVVILGMLVVVKLIVVVTVVAILVVVVGMMVVVVFVVVAVPGFPGG